MGFNLNFFMRMKRTIGKRNGDNLSNVDDGCPPKKRTLKKSYSSNNLLELLDKKEKKESDIDELISSLATKVSISKSSNFSYQNGLPDFLLPQDKKDDSLEKSSTDDYDGIEF